MSVLADRRFLAALLLVLGPVWAAASGWTDNNLGRQEKASPAASEPLPLPAWMAGDWSRQAAIKAADAPPAAAMETEIREHWESPRGGRMLSGC